MQVMVDTILSNCLKDLPIFPSNYFKQDGKAIELLLLSAWKQSFIVERHCFPKGNWVSWCKKDRPIWKLDIMELEVG